MVKDKINHRARGPKTSLTRQTVGGRANDGGLRIGEMERDGIIGHGASKFLQESMLIRGDEYFMAVCNNTGTIAIYNNSQNIFLSPMVDGPIKFHSTINNNNLHIENISKYGRNFSILRIPYAFKLLIQELQVMNIQMRLITEDNIEQLTSLGFSNNIARLSKNNESDIQLQINKMNKNNKNELNKDESILVPEPLNEPIEFPKQHNNLTPEELGWSYYSYDEERGEAYKSIILDSKGNSTEIWFVGEHDGDLPNIFPLKWNNKSLYFNDKTRIPNNIMIEALNNNQVPNNWSISLDYIQNPNMFNDDISNQIEVKEPETGFINVKPRYKWSPELAYWYMNLTDDSKRKIMNLSDDLKESIMTKIVSDIKEKYSENEPQLRLNMLKNIEIKSYISTIYNNSSNNPVSEINNDKQYINEPQESLEVQSTYSNEDDKLNDLYPPDKEGNTWFSEKKGVSINREIPSEIIVDTIQNDDKNNKLLAETSKSNDDGIELLIDNNLNNKLDDKNEKSIDSEETDSSNSKRIIL
jgi:hypothetical protein